TKKSIFYFIILSILLALMALIGSVLPFSDYTNNLIGQSIVTMSLLIYLVKDGKYNNLQINLKNIHIGFIIGIYILLMAVLNLLSGAETILTINYSFIIVISLILTNLMVALFEEVVCRGIIFNEFLKNNTPLKAGLLSSAIFALAHFLNITHNPDFLGVFTQVVYTFFLGMIFAAIYYYTKNLLTAILLHFILDLTSGFYELKPVKVASDSMTTTVNDMFVTILISLPCLLIGYYLLKKKSSK
ncbi:TPA: CPBP family intramembrane metalloprotease, partial [Staphylococcus aureus]|nr:CPBP family intramembrane metalloprotease [Staphylococcus aureus]